MLLCDGVGLSAALPGSISLFEDTDKVKLEEGRSDVGR